MTLTHFLMNSDGKIMFQSCRKSSTFYTKVDEEDEEEQESGKKCNSLEHLPLTRLRSLKGNEEVSMNFSILYYSPMHF